MLIVKIFLLFTFLISVCSPILPTYAANLSDYADQLRSSPEKKIVGGDKNSNKSVPSSAIKDIKNCSVFWSGSSFIKAPPNTGSSLKIGVKAPDNFIYMPSEMDRALMHKLIFDNFSSIQKLCPAITFD